MEGKINLNRLERELKIRHYSPRTVKTYLYWNRRFLNYVRKSPREITGDDIKNYLAYLIKSKNTSSNTNGLILNALGFYYQNVLHRRLFTHIQYPKKEAKLPVILSSSEIKKLLNHVNHVKHKLLLSLMYAAGLRISEAIKLKVKDLDFANHVLYVRKDKGNQDRQTFLPVILHDILEKYVSALSTNSLIFASNRGGPLSQRAVQKVFSNALKQANIKKEATCHSLRHSFATHLLEAGTNIRYIQAWLGHKRLETTQIYTKVTSNKLKNITSPLDKFY